MVDRKQQLVLLKSTSITCSLNSHVSFYQCKIILKFTVQILKDHSFEMKQRRDGGCKEIKKVCVHVCERERERGEAKMIRSCFHLISKTVITCNYVKLLPSRSLSPPPLSLSLPLSLPLSLTKQRGTAAEQGQPEG